MAQVSKPSLSQPTVRRIWRTRGSKLNWVFLGIALVLLVGTAWIYHAAVISQRYPGPYTTPLREFGIVAFVLVLMTAAYTLRRRSLGRLPGRVQDWLWLHIWFGIVSVLIVFMHDNFQGITHDFSWLRDRFTEAAYGTTALYALFALVLTGVIGRLLDIRQARVIAAEADSNGVGISRSIEDYLFELSLSIERLSAGKSAPFKLYCDQALQTRGQLPGLLPVLAPREEADFQRVYEVLNEYVRLDSSLRRQRRARQIIHLWRYIHIPIACGALLVISYHSVFELWKMLILHQ